MTNDKTITTDTRNAPASCGATISEFSITDHGIEHAQYFQGAGVAFTQYEYCATGCGDDFAEAIEDALESMAQGEECDGIDFDLLETRIKAQEFDGARDWPKSESASDRDSSEDSELYYYVTIKYNVVQCAPFDAPPFNEYGHFTGHLPDDCVTACSHAGRCDDDVEYWRKRLNFTVPRDKAISHLAEYGAWPKETNEYDEGLRDMSDEELAEKVLWLACGDIEEQGEWSGMCS